jgi:hypothetical protein
MREEIEISLCKRHHYKGVALAINCHECRAEADEDQE